MFKNWLSGRLIVLVIVLFIAGIMLTVGGVSDIIKINGTVKDFNYDSMQDIKKGEIVCGEVGYILDCYAGETTTNTTMGIETSSRTSREYFIMPLLNDTDSEKDMYITVSAAKAEDRQLLYAICDDTYASLDGEDVQWHDMLFVAKVKPLEADLTQFLREWFEEAEYFEAGENISSHIVPFELAYYDPNTAYTNLIIGLIFIAAVIVVVFIFIHLNRKKSAPENSMYIPQGVQTSVSNAADIGAPAGGFAENTSSQASSPYITQPVQPDDFFAKPEKAVRQNARDKSEPTPEPAKTYSDTNIDTSEMNTEQKLYEQEQAIAANVKQVEYDNKLETEDMDAEQKLYEQEQAIAANTKQIEYDNKLETEGMDTDRKLYEQEQAIIANTKQTEYDNKLETEGMDAEQKLYEQEQAIAAGVKAVEYDNAIDTSELDTDSLEYYGSSGEEDDNDIFEFNNDGDFTVNADDIELT